jgi:hypothetical protein
MMSLQLSREGDNSQACIFFYFVSFDHRRERLKRCYGITVFERIRAPKTRTNSPEHLAPFLG